MRGHTLVLGATPSFSNVAKSLRFTTSVLTRTFRAHTQIKIWPEVSSGRWLVSESDRDLKKSLFPSVFFPLLLGDPKETFAFSSSPWKPIAFSCMFEKNTCRSALSISNLTSGANQYSEEHSGSFSKGTPFYVHHLYTTIISPVPHPQQNNNFWIAWSVKDSSSSIKNF